VVYRRRRHSIEEREREVVPGGGSLKCQARCEATPIFIHRLTDDYRQTIPCQPCYYIFVDGAMSPMNIRGIYL
jgi:hypothetical protein